MSYSINSNDEIFSSAGELIAKKNEDGTLIYAPGMKSRHAAKLRKWLNGEEVEAEPPTEAVIATETTEENSCDVAEADWRKNLGDWKLDKTLGVSTPEFKKFVAKYNLSPEEQTELIVLKLRIKNFVK